MYLFYDYLQYNKKKILGRGEMTQKISNQGACLSSTGFLYGISRQCSNSALPCSADRKPGVLPSSDRATGYKYYTTGRIRLKHTNKCCKSGSHDYPSINSVPVNSERGGEKDKNLVNKTVLSFKAFRSVEERSYILWLLIFSLLI